MPATGVSLVVANVEKPLSDGADGPDDLVTPEVSFTTDGGLSIRDGGGQKCPFRSALAQRAAHLRATRTSSWDAEIADSGMWDRGALDMSAAPSEAESG